MGLSACATSVAPSANSNSKRELVWADEFEGSTIDASKWNYDLDCWGGGNDERQCYTDTAKNAFVNDGVLTIRAHHETASGPALPPHMRFTEEDENRINTKPFTSARLTTKGKGDWTYGRIEVRAKLPEGQGTWPAIWMLPTDKTYGGWAASGEIDIMEAINLGARCEGCKGGRENYIHGTLHYGGAWPDNVNTSRKTRLPKSGDGFHVYAIDWREGQIDWFIDGKRYARQTSDIWFSDTAPKSRPHAPFDQRFHLILNLAIGGKWPEGHNEGGVDETGFPKEMQIDWVRVYK